MNLGCTTVWLAITYHASAQNKTWASDCFGSQQTIPLHPLQTLGLPLFNNNMPYLLLDIHGITILFGNAANACHNRTTGLQARNWWNDELPRTVWAWNSLASRWFRVYGFVSQFLPAKNQILEDRSKRLAILSLNINLHDILLDLVATYIILLTNLTILVPLTKMPSLICQSFWMARKIKGDIIMHPAPHVTH